jgi:dTDP-4-amino-4,6-dideoxygalactose transaminase
MPEFAASQRNSLMASYQSAVAGIVGASYAYAFWKGRVALYAILEALGIGHGDQVILPGFTCVVVPNAVRFAGGTPVFADVDPDTYNIDPVSVERAITRRTRVLLIQHTFGIPAEMDTLLDMATQHRLTVVEDCAHALGSTYRGRPVGTFGRAAFFSSQWSKPYTTGLGGMAVASDAQMAERLQALQAEFAEPPLASVMRLRWQYAVYRRLFSPRLFWVATKTLRHLSRRNLFVGSSSEAELAGTMPADATWRMSEFQAQVGLKRINTLPQNLAHRNRIAKFYEEHLQTHGWPLAAGPKEAATIFLRYPLRVLNKWELLHRAASMGIELGSWFESVLHPIRHPAGYFGYRVGQCPVAEQAAAELINLPLHPRVSIADAERIIKFVCRAAKRPSATIELRLPVDEPRAAAAAHPFSGTKPL